MKHLTTEPARISRSVKLVFICTVIQSVTVINSSDMITSEIIEATRQGAANCLDWKLIGTCFWLECGLTGCTVRTSPKVSHFLPDLVVTVQTEPAQQAWREMRTFYHGIQEQAIETAVGVVARHPAGFGSLSMSSINSSSISLRYLEADVFGHPQPSLAIVNDYGFTCRSVTTRLYPYYMSAMDAIAWRDPSFDRAHLASTTPGQFEIGRWPFNSWGSVFPRTGWVKNADLAMGAAVTAQRAAFIATGDDVLRPHTRVGTGTRTNRAPGRIDTNDAFKGKWQLIHPVIRDSCSVFGSRPSPMQRDRREDHHLVWNLWRGYKCCQKAGQYFIGDAEF